MCQRHYEHNRYWNHPHVKEGRNRSANRYYARHRDQWWPYYLRKKYGLEVDEYEALLDSQDRKCAICGKQDGGKGARQSRDRLCVDHDHDTGAIRAMLCNNCNAGIGYLADDPTRLLDAMLYLIAHGK